MELWKEYCGNGLQIFQLEAEIKTLQLVDLPDSSHFQTGQIPFQHRFETRREAGNVELTAHGAVQKIRSKYDEPIVAIAGSLQMDRVDTVPGRVVQQRGFGQLDRSLDVFQAGAREV